MKENVPQRVAALNAAAVFRPAVEGLEKPDGNRRYKTNFTNAFPAFPVSFAE